MSGTPTLLPLNGHLLLGFWQWAVTHGHRPVLMVDGAAEGIPFLPGHDRQKVYAFSLAKEHIIRMRLDEAGVTLLVVMEGETHARQLFFPYHALLSIQIDCDAGYGMNLKIPSPEDVAVMVKQKQEGKEKPGRLALVVDNTKSMDQK